MIRIRVNQMVTVLGTAAMAALLWLGAPAAAVAQPVSLTANLTGGNEVPPNGSVNTGGTFVTVNTATGEIAWNTTSSIPIGLVAAHHIHSGVAGVNGPVLVNFNGQYTGTVTVPLATAASIAANPSAFYVNLHTTAFPGGELRGQLAVLAAAGTVPVLGMPLIAALAAGLAIFGAFMVRRGRGG
jgi:CHRD domain